MRRRRSRPATGSPSSSTAPSTACSGTSCAGTPRASRSRSRRARASGSRCSTRGRSRSTTASIRASPSAQQVQSAETAFHLGLIAHLQDINPIYLIQEPPAHLSVTDSAGRVTGMASDGRAVHEIPGSVSVADRSGYSAVALLTPRGRYTVTASGPARSTYSLTMDELQRGGRAGLDQVEATAGTFARSGRVSVCLPAGGIRCSASILRLPAFTVHSRSRVMAPPWGPLGQ